jgi:hypothetical protein
MHLQYLYADLKLIDTHLEFFFHIIVYAGYDVSWFVE